MTYGGPGWGPLVGWRLVHFAAQRSAPATTGHHWPPLAGNGANDGAHVFTQPQSVPGPLAPRVVLVAAAATRLGRR
ncbi:hypothetical protein H696_00636 [Fonticula alba]|uniref:Uncharacterized protein n=1 Tax=Fonticula alba TaxID=691883 RepID=A0A058ZGJ7_FONAL|nr:hypothetical protein H696_00636 [Fonticula alba]KCV73091.1 hypothetical protein H696_00636 [Fonticula alba]|eukprot:XP_009492792.1 hypothetical protein H696_00636 [Fonticula alba]